MSEKLHDLLWRRVRAALVERQALAEGNATVGEIASWAKRKLGNDDVGRFVSNYYQPLLYDEAAGRTLSDAEAERLVAALEALPRPPASEAGPRGEADRPAKPATSDGSVRSTPAGPAIEGVAIGGDPVLEVAQQRIRRQQDRLTEAQRRLNEQHQALVTAMRLAEGEKAEAEAHRKRMAQEQAVQNAQQTRPAANDTTSGRATEDLQRQDLGKQILGKLSRVSTRTRLSLLMQVHLSDLLSATSEQNRLDHATLVAREIRAFVEKNQHMPRPITADTTVDLEREEAHEQYLEVMGALFDFQLPTFTERFMVMAWAIALEILGAWPAPGCTRFAQAIGDDLLRLAREANELQEISISEEEDEEDSWMAEVSSDEAAGLLLNYLARDWRPRANRDEPSDRLFFLFYPEGRARVLNSCGRDTLAKAIDEAKNRLGRGVLRRIEIQACSDGSHGSDAGFVVERANLVAAEMATCGIPRSMLTTSGDHSPPDLSNGAAFVDREDALNRRTVIRIG